MSNLTLMDNRIEEIFGTANETPASLAMLEACMSLAPSIYLDIKVPTDTKISERVR